MFVLLIFLSVFVRVIIRSRYNVVISVFLIFNWVKQNTFYFAPIQIFLLWIWKYRFIDESTEKLRTQTITKLYFFSFMRIIQSKWKRSSLQKCVVSFPSKGPLRTRSLTFFVNKSFSGLHEKLLVRSNTFFVPSTLKKDAF